MEQESFYYKINICFWQALGTILYLNNYKRKEDITYAQNERQQKPS